MTHGIHQIAQHLAKAGRHGDDTLVHMNRGEQAFMEHLTGTPMTQNPTTGLPEAFSLWKAILGGAAIAASAIPGVGAFSVPIGISMLASSVTDPGSNPNDAATKAQKAQQDLQKQQAANFVKIPEMQTMANPNPIYGGLPGTGPQNPLPIQRTWTGNNIGVGQGYFATGGNVGDGGKEMIQTSSQGDDAQSVVVNAIAALEGRYPRPQQAIKRFIEMFGQAEFNDMKDSVLNGGGEEDPEDVGMLGSSSPGMKDDIPASINGKEPVRLSGGEFVVPADVVAHLGDGNSQAGAQHLYTMMDKVRQQKTGRTQQPGPINPAKVLPGGTNGRR